jgi:hypothetical protein
VLGDDIVTLLQKSPMTQGEIAAATGYSKRHLRRILPRLEGIVARKDGRRLVYSAASAASSSDDATTTITTNLPERGHPAGNADILPESGQMSAINSGHRGHGGHFPKGIKKQGTRNEERPPNQTRQDPNGAHPAPQCTLCQSEGDANTYKCRSCPLSFGGPERDTIQYVIVDQVFRDLIERKAKEERWKTDTKRGTVWVRLKHLTLQLGYDSVTFYSDEPEDLDWVATWVKKNFAGTYPDITSLAARVRRPEELTKTELTVVVTDRPTIDAMMDHISLRMQKTGVYYLSSPNPNIPGFKAYMHDGTLRCEFDGGGPVKPIAALAMRQRLFSILPMIAGSPGLFVEFLTDYYSPAVHPIIIDTGVDGILKQFTSFAETLTDKFTTAMHEFTRARTVQAQLPVISPEEEAKIAEINAAIEAFQGFEIDEVLKAFRRTLKLDERATSVYLAAWSAWASRQFKGRVLKEDIASVLLRAGKPLEVAEIAVAIDRLITVGLMQQDPRLEVKFSPGGVALARKLMAKQEEL